MILQAFLFAEDILKSNQMVDKELITVIAAHEENKEQYKSWSYIMAMFAGYNGGFGHKTETAVSV